MRSAEQKRPQDHHHHLRQQRLTPPLGFYLGLYLFFFFYYSPFLFPFSRHIRDFAATAMLAATSLSGPFFTSVPLIHPTPRSGYHPTPRSGYRPLVISAISSDREALPMAPSSSKWAQKTVVLPAQSRGCHLVTSKIMREIERDLSGFECGLAHFFLQHTSASLTINENYDQDVQADTETFLNRIVPEGRSAPWRHTLEGPDDMPAHIKSSMFGCSLTIPITNGGLNMGTWQGIWLCEHRDHATPRKIVVTMNGM